MHKNSKKLFADVALVAKSLPRKKNIYTYICDTSFSLGDLVEIPFGKKTLQGIIIAFHKTSFGKYTYKNISRKIQSPAITPSQHELALFLSQEYVTPFGSIVRSCFFPRKPRKEISLPDTILTQKKALPLSKEHSKLLEKINTHKKNILLQEPSGEDRLRKLFTLAQETIKNESQVLIIFPDKNTLLWAYDIAHSFFEESSLCLIHGSLTPLKKYICWNHIQSQSSLLVLGTKSALFTPLRNLGLAILEDEHRTSHKQREVPPRYDTRRALIQLAKIHQCPIIMTSGTPSIESTHLGKTSSWHISSPKSKQEKQKPLIVNMKLEVYKNKKKSFSKTKQLLLSEILIHTIKETLHKKLPFFLFVSRRGMHTFSFCSDCKKMLTCPKCQHALSEQSNETYKCMYCDFISKAFMECPHCHGMRFTHKNVGTQAIERNIKMLFPYSCVVRIDADTTRSKTKKKEEAFQEKLQKAHIIIGTPSLASLPFLRKPGGIGIIEAESFLQWPEYLAEEQAFQFFSHLANLSFSEPKNPIPFLIQTFNEHHRIIQALSSSQEEVLFKKSLEQERKDLLYPPFSRILLLTGSYKTEKKALKDSEGIYTNLKEALPKTIHISLPFSPMRNRKDFLLQKNIVIKIPKQWNYPLNKKVYKTLLSLPPHWTIDVDPKEIL